uniref:UDP glucuronosyltransferase 5 family, polypeptide D1 n=1 Tax=Cynoglossus semilaevis TaxID=244447 RepID=A0A3P8WR99_CYNSE
VREPPYQSCGIFALLCVSLISFTPSCDGGNILVFPVDGSHWINMKVLLEELHARGHNLTVIRASTSWYIPEESPMYSSITINMTEDERFEDFFDEFLREQMRVWNGGSAISHFKITKFFLSLLYNVHLIWTQCAAQIFDDKSLIETLLDSKYDLVLTDPAIAPGVLLARYLKLPVVLNVRWIPSGEGHLAIAPTPASYIPAPGSGLTDNMTFLQRTKNLFFYGIILFQQRFIVGPHYDVVCQKYFEGECDIISVLQEADIWLFRSDFVFDFPRPTMPNIVYIGGFQCRKIVLKCQHSCYQCGINCAENKDSFKTAT